MEDTRFGTYVFVYMTSTDVMAQIISNCVLGYLPGENGTRWISFGTFRQKRIQTLVWRVEGEIEKIMSGWIFRRDVIYSALIRNSFCFLLSRQRAERGGTCLIRIAFVFVSKTFLVDFSFFSFGFVDDESWIATPILWFDSGELMNCRRLCNLSTKFLLMRCVIQLRNYLVVRRLTATTNNCAPFYRNPLPYTIRFYVPKGRKSSMSICVHLSKILLSSSH